MDRSRLDCAAFHGAFEEASDLSDLVIYLYSIIVINQYNSIMFLVEWRQMRPAVANLAAAQSALGSAQRETEKQLLDVH